MLVCSLNAVFQANSSSIETERHDSPSAIMGSQVHQRANTAYFTEGQREAIAILKDYTCKPFVIVRNKSRSFQNYVSKKIPSRSKISTCFQPTPSQKEALAILKMGRHRVAVSLRLSEEQREAFNILKREFLQKLKEDSNKMYDSKEDMWRFITSRIPESLPARPNPRAIAQSTGKHLEASRKWIAKRSHSFRKGPQVYELGDICSVF